MIGEFFGDRKSRCNDERTFLTFAVLHLYLYAHALDAADIVIDVNALTADPACGREVSSQIEAATGIRIDLSDCRQSFDGAIFDCQSKVGFVDTIEQFVKIIATYDVSPAAMERVNRMKDDMLAEWERSEFYSSRIRSQLVDRSARLEVDLQRCAAEYDELRRQCVAAEQRARAAEALYQAINRSTFWRVTGPFRRVGSRFPVTTARVRRVLAAPVRWCRYIAHSRRLIRPSGVTATLASSA
jgi:hypothetical protein